MPVTLTLHLLQVYLLHLTVSSCSPTLIYPAAFLNYAYMVRAAHFVLLCIYAMPIKKALIQAKNLVVTQPKYTTTPKYLTL